MCESWNKTYYQYLVSIEIYISEIKLSFHINFNDLLTQLFASVSCNIHIQLLITASGQIHYLSEYMFKSNSSRSYVFEKHTRDWGGRKEKVAKHDEDDFRNPWKCKVTPFLLGWKRLKRGQNEIIIFCITKFLPSNIKSHLSSDHKACF